MSGPTHVEYVGPTLRKVATTRLEELNTALKYASTEHTCEIKTVSVHWQHIDHLNPDRKAKSHSRT